MNNNQGRRRTRRARNQRKQRNTQISRILLTICMMALVAVVSIGGTLAWLTDDTETITNTFTKSDVTVELDETTGETYQMVPGNTITKDPMVTLTAGSEDSWVFVKIEKENDFDTYMSYTMADGWTELDGVNGVYYYTGTITKGEAIQVIEGNNILVNDQLTKDNMTTAEANPPQLKVTAFACQKANVATAAEAWSYIQNNGKTPANP